jgi:hypothetical protein
MTVSAFGVAALIAVASHAVQPSTITVGKVSTFKDWTVGCDNGLACQAVALMPETGTEQQFSMVVKRPESVTAPLAIELAGAQSKSTTYRVFVDGKAVTSGAIMRDSDFIAVGGAEAMKLARAMAKGKAIQVVDGNGANLGIASLAGASAALRYIDAQQGRVGTTGAIIATGRRKATATKAMLPVITAKKITPSNVLPDAGALVALSETSPCAADRFDSTQDTAYSLGTGANGAQALVLLNCGAGAYNFSSGVYIGKQDSFGRWSFAPAKFDYGATGFGEDSQIPLLVNADWDSGTQTITSYAKGRGLGDCGSSEKWVWDGDMFRLTGATLMGECRGSLDWIPVWRAEVRLTP